MAAKPIRLINPYLLLGTEDLTCFASHITLDGEEDDELATFCNPLGYAWNLELELKMSLGPDSLEAALNAIGPAGNVVPFTFAYAAGEGGAAPTGDESNPVWTGEVRLVPWPIVDADINGPTTFTMTMPLIGEPVRTPEVAPVAITRATSSDSDSGDLVGAGVN